MSSAGINQIKKHLKTCSVTLIFIINSVALEAVGQEVGTGYSQNLSCSSLDTEQRQILQEIHKYAHITEHSRISNITNSNCGTDGSIISLSPFMEEEFDNLMSAMEEDSVFREYYDNADISLDLDQEGGVAVQCNSSDPDNRPIYQLKLTLKRYQILVNDFLTIGYSFKEELRVSNNGDRDDTTGFVLWNPYYDEDEGEIVIAFPGTEPTSMLNILANYNGDNCVFPVMNIAFKHIFEENYSDENRNVLTGHSLGGQAVQYLVEHGNGDNRLIDQAFAFASTRQRHSDQNYQNIVSFLLAGDRVLQRLELGDGQIGTVITYDDPDNNCMSYLNHEIATINQCICSCLNDQGSLTISGDFSNRWISND